jgi:hypothetical protein
MAAIAVNRKINASGAQLSSFYLYLGSVSNSIKGQ